MQRRARRNVLSQNKLGGRRKALALAQFDWNPQTHRMLFGAYDIPYEIPAEKPELPAGDPKRLYSVKELQKTLSERDMKIVQTFSDYAGKPASPKELPLIVYALKER